jgi:cytochrome b561
MPQFKLTNTVLVALVTVTLFAILCWLVLRGALPPAWRTPGSPLLYLCGLAGALLLLVPAAFAIAKRGGRSRQPVAWFNAHVVCACLGSALIAVHSAGHLDRAPALLLLALAALGGLGVWGRLRAARLLAATFASKVATFSPPDAATRARLQRIIERKRALLPGLAPQASEGTFSVTLPLLLRNPGAALAYRALEREETRLLGTRRVLPAAQAWWRPLHLAIAWLFVAGVVIHVVTVTFFAGYVADYGPVGWWHLTAW